MATVTTMTEATIVRIEKAVMVRALQHRLEFSEKFLARNVADSCLIPGKNGWPDPSTLFEPLLIPRY